MVTDGPPVKLTLSITSGYSVPCARKSAPPTFVRLLLEHFDEQPADRLAFQFRIGDAIQRVEEQVGCVAMHQFDIEPVAERGDDVVRLALPQQPVIDENAGQLLADRLMDQHRGDRRIDPAGQPADHPPGAHLLPDPGDLRGAEPGHRPRCRTDPATLWVKLRNNRAPCGVCTTSGWNIRP